MAQAYGDLTHYFKTQNALPFDDVQGNSEAFFGDPAEAIFTKLAESMSIKIVERYNPVKDKTKERKKKIIRTPMKRMESPYKEVEACIKAAQDYSSLVDSLLEFEKVAFTAQLNLERILTRNEPAPLPASNTLSVVRLAAGEKRAYNPTLMGGMATGTSLAMGMGVGNSIMKDFGPESKDKLKSDAFMKVTDPDHESKLRSIRSQAALHGLLNSPYFEGEDPYQVTDLFNKVTKMSPRIADQPLALEAILRRYMSQGQADTHDLDQLMGLETKLKQRDEPSRETNLPKLPGSSIIANLGGGGKKEADE